MSKLTRHRWVVTMLALFVIAVFAAAPAQGQMYSISVRGQQAFGYGYPVLTISLYASQQTLFNFTFVSGTLQMSSLTGPYAMSANASIGSAVYTEPSPGVHQTVLKTMNYTHYDLRNWVPGYSSGMVWFPAYAVIEVTTLQDRPGTAYGSMVKVGFKIYDNSIPTAPVLYMQSTQQPPDGSPFSIGDPNLPYWLEPLYRGSATLQF
jgi:hypothetical protein